MTKPEAPPAAAARPRAGIGFWAGFRFGLGLCSAFALAFLLVAGAAAGTAWWAYGSLRAAAGAASSAAYAEIRGVARAAAESAGQGLTDARDRAVARAADAAARAGQSARDAAGSASAAAAATASGARDAVTGRLGGIADRLRRRGDPAPLEPSKEDPAAAPMPSTPARP